MVSLLRIPFIVSLKKLAASEHLACVLVLGFFGLLFFFGGGCVFFFVFFFFCSFFFYSLTFLVGNPDNTFFQYSLKHSSRVLSSFGGGKVD